MTHVIVTGGSSGIGLAVAHLYAQRGARLSLIARTVGPLETARKMLAAVEGAGTVHIESADVASETDVERAIRACEARQGPCDILITSAGIVEPGLFEQLTSDDFGRQIDTNFLGTTYAVRAVYAAMKARRSGAIMMVSSGAGLIGIPGYAAYCASKYALHGFAEALRSEAKPHSVTISICFPPDTQTPQFTREIQQRPPEASVIMGTVAPWQPADVATRIVRAIDRKRFEVFFGLTLMALGRFGSLVKPVLNGWFDRSILKIRRP